MKKIKNLLVIICIFQLFYMFYFRSGFKYEVIKNPFNKNSGVSYAVSSEVIEANNILNKRQLLDFNLSDALKNDTYLYQRIIEFSYPIRIKKYSKNILSFKGENISTSCQILETGKSLKLAECK